MALFASWKWVCGTGRKSVKLKFLLQLGGVERAVDRAAKVTLSRTQIRTRPELEGANIAGLNCSPNYARQGDERWE